GRYQAEPRCESDMPCFLFYPTLVPTRFFLLTSYAAFATHLWELDPRLFLLVSRLTHPLLFRQVGFLHRWVSKIFLDMGDKML
ncbi:MAG: hypothetical protein PVJ21_20795, partial [Anaerolineales bacterium]